MRIDPVLRALRSDDAPQRRAQSDLEATRDGWRASAVAAPVLAEFDRYGAGAPLEECAALDGMVVDADRACAFLDPLIEDLTASLRRHPLGQIPFRHQYSSGISVLLLAESGRAALTLVTYEGARAGDRREARSVCFSDGERHECCLAGAASGRMVTLIEDGAGSARLGIAPLVLRAGDTLGLDGATAAKLVDRVDGRLTMLRLVRVPRHAEPAREFSLDGGVLLHRASGDRRESREEMTIALLGRMGRKDAVPAIEGLIEEGSDHLRWQALRQCLALDTARGFAALARIAADPGDALAAPAGALRAALVEAHPQLARLESAACRA